MGGDSGFGASPLSGPTPIPCFLMVAVSLYGYSSVLFHCRSHGALGIALFFPTYM